MKVLYRRKSFTLAIVCVSAALAGQAIDKPLSAQAAAPANPTAPADQPGRLTSPARPPLPPLPSTTGPKLIPRNRARPLQPPGSVVIGPVVPGAPPVATVPPAATCATSRAHALPGAISCAGHGAEHRFGVGRREEAISGQTNRGERPLCVLPHQRLFGRSDDQQRPDFLWLHCGQAAANAMANCARPKRPHRG